MATKIVDATLTKTQKNAILAHITKAGLKPAEFDWSEATSNEYQDMSLSVYSASKLTHLSTGHYFTFGNNVVEYSPGRNSKVERERQLDSFHDKLVSLVTWLPIVKQEADAPDLWAAIGAERELSTAAASALENSPFTPTEREKIQQALYEIESYVLAGNQFQAQQAKFVEYQFRYLGEALERVGRKDWLLILYATLVNTAVTVALPPENIHGLLNLAATLFKGLWIHAQNLIR